MSLNRTLALTLPAWLCAATPATDAARRSTLVFIGRNLPRAELRAGLDACLV